METALYYSDTSSPMDAYQSTAKHGSYDGSQTPSQSQLPISRVGGEVDGEDDDDDDDDDEDEDDENEDSLKMITTHFARLQDEKSQHMKKTREINVQIKELTVRIESFMKNHDLDDIQLANDKAVKRVVTNRVEPINKDTLATILSQHSKIKDIHEAREISEFVFTNRGRNESMAIRYTGGRK